MESKELKRYDIEGEDSYANEGNRGEYVLFSDIAHLLTPQDDEGFDEKACELAAIKDADLWNRMTNEERERHKLTFNTGARWMFNQLRKGPR